VVQLRRSAAWITGVNVLAHGSQYDAEEPASGWKAVSASGERLEQVEVVILSLDGALRAGTGIFAALPKVTIPGDKSMQAERGACVSQGEGLCGVRFCTGSAYWHF